MEYNPLKEPIIMVINIPNGYVGKTVLLVVFKVKFLKFKFFRLVQLAKVPDVERSVFKV